MALPSPQQQKRIIAEAARSRGIDPAILWGLYGAETNFGRNVSTSGAGAIGPFQFMPATARGLGIDPLDFRSAAFGAARYLAQYKDRGVKGMLGAYNAGPAGSLTNPETAAYIPKVLQLAKTWDGPAGGSGAVQPPFSIQRRNVVDQAGLGEAERRYALAQMLSNAPRSPFDIGPRASIETRSVLLSVLPSTPPNPADFLRTISALRRTPGITPGQQAPRLPRGGGYAGTEAIVKQLADPVAAKAGIKASNYKRTPAENAAVGGAPDSDHLTTNKRSFAADYPTTNGERLAHQLARAVGIKDFTTGNYNRYTVKIGGRQFRVQILWNVEGHHDHVHFGLEAI